MGWHLSEGFLQFTWSYKAGGYFRTFHPLYIKQATLFKIIRTSVLLSPVLATLCLPHRSAFGASAQTLTCTCLHRPAHAHREVRSPPPHGCGRRCLPSVHACGLKHINQFSKSFKNLCNDFSNLDGRWALCQQKPGVGFWHCSWWLRAIKEERVKQGGRAQLCRREVCVFNVLFLQQFKVLSQVVYISNFSWDPCPPTLCVSWSGSCSPLSDSPRWGPSRRLMCAWSSTGPRLLSADPGACQR